MILSKLSEMLVRGSRSANKPEDYTASPRSPLDFEISEAIRLSGVGLGFVAALEESSIAINRHDPVRYSGRIRYPEEEYTYVTSRDGLTKVYFNDDGFELYEKPMVIIADEPPVTKRQNYMGGSTTEFLSNCCLCRKKLQGKDIYIYKGEMGFCSVECRSVQIMNDERKEQC